MDRNAIVEGAPDFVEDEITQPVDPAEMAAVARASRLVADPNQPPRVIRRDQLRAPSEHAVRPGEPFAEVQIAGSAQVVTLPAHNLSPTGIALAIPDGVDLTVAEGATVMVQLHMGESDGVPIHARVPAVVHHHRQGSCGRPGGLALRWDQSNPSTAREIERVLAARAS